MKKISIQLEELVCPMCATKIETALKNLKGVTSANVLYNASKAKLEYDEELLTLDDIRNTIEKAGYEILKII